jgi:ankyrin repeat protein
VAFLCALLPDIARAQSPLVDAVRSGDGATVRTLLRRAGSATAAAADGTTPLHWAARGDRVEIVRDLIAAGADVNAANRYGMTPLMLAAIEGNGTLVKALAEAGADVTATLPHGQTPLMAAARAGSREAVAALLARGADVNARERRLGETALMWAAAENHGAVVEQLLAHGADAGARSNTAVFPRYSFGDGIVALMMTLPRGSWTPSMYAARQGSLDAARALAAGGADLDAGDPQGTTALMLAIDNAHYDTAMLLVERGAKPNVADTVGMTALYAAVNMHTLGDLPGRPAPKTSSRATVVDVARTLLARGADPNARLTAPLLQRHHSGGDGALGAGATPLLRAAKTGDIELLRLLLEHGADPALTTKTGTTAVMLAAGPASGGLGGTFPVSDADKVGVIRMLVERGLDVSATDTSGSTALHVAAGQAGEPIVRELLRHGARLDLKDKQGRTPLDVALGVGGRGQPVVRQAIADVLRAAASSPVR